MASHVTLTVNTSIHSEPSEMHKLTMADMKQESDSTSDFPKKCADVSAPDANKHDPHKHESPTSSRQIRFHDEPYVIDYLPLSKDISPQEKEATWWNINDFLTFQYKARSISKEVRRNRRLTIGIDEAYLKAEQLAKITDESQLEAAIQAMSINMGLAHWCTHGDSRRGLERWGSRLHHASRNELARQVKSDVTGLQFLSPHQLRQQAELRSRVARIFARMMGEADAAAAHYHNMPHLRRWSALATSVASPAVWDPPMMSHGKYRRAASLDRLQGCLPRHFDGV